MSCVDFNPVDQFAFDYDYDLGEDLAPTHYSGDVLMAFDSSLLPDLISTGDHPFLLMDQLDYYQESTGLVPYDPMAFLQDTPGPVGIFPPLPTDYHYQPSALKPFDGIVPTQDTCWNDIRRYMDKHGKAPFISAFSEEDVGSGRPRVRSKSNRLPSNIPVTPVRKRVAPLPNRVTQASSLSPVTTCDFSDNTPLNCAKQAFSSSPLTTSDSSENTPLNRVNQALSPSPYTACDSSDDMPLKRTTTPKKHVPFKVSAIVDGPKETSVLDAPTEEPLTKKAKSELINSTCATDDLPPPAPIPLLVDTSVASSSPPSAIVFSPKAVSESFSEPPSTPECTKPKTRKRKLDDMDQEDYRPEKVANQAPADAKWEKRDEFCSTGTFKGKMRYRCDLCHEKGRIMVTNSHGDLKRHLDSLAHRKKSFKCLDCGKDYTRPDALKRHRYNCKGTRNKATN